MKKSFVILIVLFLLSAGTVAFAANALLDEQENVQYTENILYGDASIVDDVTVERNCRYDHYIYWNSVCTIGELSESISTCNVYEWGKLESSQNYSVHIYSSEEDPYWNEFENVDLIGIATAYKELSDSLGAGEFGAKRIYLKDYMDYYMIDASIDLPSDIFLVTNDVTWKRYSKEEGESPEHKILLNIRNKINDFFKIPVLEEETRHIEIKKDEEGKLTQYGGQSVGSQDTFWFSAMTTYTDTDCYITFNTRTDKGDIVDTSQIPGGYGIYGFSYDSEKNTVDIDGLKLVYELDPSVDVVNFGVDAKKQNLLLITSADECNTITIIDIATMKKKASFTYGENVKKEERYSGLDIYDDFMVVTYSDEGHALIYSVDENGDYTYEYEIKWDEAYPDISDISYGDTVYDWDGEKLLFATSIWDTEDMYIKRCSFLLGAFDENGLLYLGAYESSLDTDENGVEDVLNYICEPTYVSELEISW